MSDYVDTQTHASTNADGVTTTTETYLRTTVTTDVTTVAPDELTGHFVATDGDNEGAGTYADPWLTIAYALTQLSAGDILYIRGGTYNEQLTFNTNGTADSRITISGYPGETVTIDGEYTLPALYTSYLVRINGNYVTIRDITIYHSNGCMLLLNGIYDHAINIMGVGGKESGIVLNAAYGFADGCIVTDAGNGYNPPDQPTWGNAICTVGGSSHSTIQNCIAYDNYGEGLANKGDYDTLQDCIAYDNNAMQLYVNNTEYGIIRRNLVYCTVGARYGPSSGIVIGGELSTPHDIEISNNLAYGNKMSLMSDSNVTTATNWTIAYNTFVNTQKTQEQIDAGYNMNVYFRTQLVNFSGSIFENNIVVEEDVRQVPINTSLTNPHVGFTFDYNCWNKAVTAAAQGPHDVVDDPDFAETDDIDNPLWYKILNTSPCRGAALILSSVDQDYWKTYRCGTPPDIGAHEYT